MFAYNLRFIFSFLLFRHRFQMGYFRFGSGPRHKRHKNVRRLSAPVSRALTITIAYFIHISSKPLFLIKCLLSYTRHRIQREIIRFLKSYYRHGNVRNPQLQFAYYVSTRYNTIRYVGARLQNDFVVITIVMSSLSSNQNHHRETHGVIMV